MVVLLQAFLQLMAKGLQLCNFKNHGAQCIEQ